MRGRRMLMMMAGMIPTPYERRVEREELRLLRYARELQAKEALMTQVVRRERGEEGTKPMPYARESHDDV